MDPSAVDRELQKYWKRYLEILGNPNWEDLNEARAILYGIGNLYCETVASQAIEKRLHLLEQPIELLDFFVAIDSESAELIEMRKDDLFKNLEEFYRAVKKFKNGYTEGKMYLDEDKFIELYNSFNPQKDLKIGTCGKYR